MLWSILARHNGKFAGDVKQVNSVITFRICRNCLVNLTLEYAVCGSTFMVDQEIGTACLSSTPSLLFSHALSYYISLSMSLAVSLSVWYHSFVLREVSLQSLNSNPRQISCIMPVKRAPSLASLHKRKRTCRARAIALEEIALR